MNLQLDSQMAHLRSSIERLASHPVLTQPAKDQALTSLAVLKAKLAAHKQAVEAARLHDSMDVELTEKQEPGMKVEKQDEADEVPCDTEEKAKV